MRFNSERRIRETWRIVASGLEQWEQTGSIEPEHLATVRTVQIDMAQHLASFIRRSDRFECQACAISRVDGGVFRDGAKALEGNVGFARHSGRVAHGPCAVIVPVSAISIAACG
jgi:hypothetical protein